MILTILFWAWILVPIAIGIGSLGQYLRDRWHSSWYSWGGALFGAWAAAFGIGAIAMVVAVFALSVVATFTGESRTATWDTQLRALNTGSEIEGRFFLGSGTLDEDPVFSFLYEQADGGVKLSSVPAEDSTVYELTDEQPYMLTHEKEHFPNEFWSPFSILTSKSHTYEFHIPAGSIVNTYEVAP